MAGREDELVAALARRAVAQAAPAELPLFRATSTAYFEDPQRALSGSRHSDDTLGFGPEIAAVLVTPVALDVARRVVAFVLDHVRATAEKEAGEAVDDATSRLLHHIGVGDDEKPEAGAGEVPELTPEQLRQVHRLAFEKAKQLHLSDEKADLLADSLAGSLAAE